MPGLVATQFFQATNELNQEFMLSDLKRSGLDPEDLESYAPSGLPLQEGALAGYVIPYFDLKGNPLTTAGGELIFFRKRMKYPEFSRAQRYTQPSAEQSAKYGLPPFLPYIPPKTLEIQGDTLICCEGEKKTVSVIKYLGLPAFGIGGAQMWRDPSGSGGVHPWIRELAAIRGISKFLIIPDGDVLRYDICAAYGTFANALVQSGYTVEILNPSGKIDDLIQTWGPEARNLFFSLPKINPLDLVQSPSSLITRYNLAFKQNEKGVKTLYQHSSNVTKLMQEHSAFPKIWRNLDTNRVMIGSEEAVPDHTEMQIANYFQHHLGMDKVNKNEVLKVIQYLARENERSPFLEYIKNLQWDGVPRLEDWMIRHWGVSDGAFAREVAKKWLISACARMAKPGTKIDWMLIVIGPQGTGKTSMPAILFKGNYTPIYGDHSDKDFHLLLHSRLCTGIDELDSFGKKETSTLKALITRNEDAFRPPYGASVENFPRRFTLYGCGNRHEFLQHDPSGYRRYAILEVDRLLDFAGLEMEVDQLWAEAWAEYSRGGVRYWEIEGASDNAENFVIANPMEEAIEQWLYSKIDDKIGDGLIDGEIWFTIQMLLGHLDMGKIGPNSSVMRDIQGILHSKGVEKTAKSIRHPKNGKVGKWMKWKPVTDV
jgi:hypothetical protein